MTTLPRRPVLALARDQRGQALPLLAISMVAILGIGALVIDVGLLMSAHRQMQMAADAAATASGQDLPNRTTAGATASLYSASSGGRNFDARWPGVVTTTQYRCVNTIVGVPQCSNVAIDPNFVIVTQEVAVPLRFARILGFTTMPVRARATAGRRGGSPRPFDVMVIIDTSASMADNCTASGTGVSSPKRIDCAKAGMRALLTALWPCLPGPSTCGALTNGHVASPLDEVGLIVFPGVRSTAVAKHRNCNMNLLDSDVLSYTSGSATYLINSLVSDYKLSNSGVLNGGGSNLVKAVHFGDGAGCSAVGYVDDDSSPFANGYGLEAEGGQGTYFAGVITLAQSTLAAGRANVQKAIILLSDGEPTTNPSPSSPNPCQKAINAAAAATAAGTWVYSVAYGASNSGISICGGTSSRTTMRNIASDTSKFFDQPATSELVSIFQRIAADLTTTRLVTDLP